MSASIYATPSHSRAAAAPQAATVPRWDLGISLLAGVLLLTIFEGAARKWLFAGNPYLRYAAYFSKDALFMLAAYLGARRGRRINLSWLVLCAGLVLLPSLPASSAHSNLVGAALSLRAYLVIPLCAFLAVPLVRHFVDIQRCALIVAMSTLPVAALGVVQYRLPVTHPLNRYDAEDAKSIAGVAGHTRSTGTFAYIAGMTTMAMLGAWSGVLLAARAGGQKPWVRALGVAAALAGGVCAAVSMSRGGVIAWGVCWAGAVLLYLRPQRALALILVVAAAGAGVAALSGESHIESALGEDSIVSGVAFRFREYDTVGDRLAQFLGELTVGLGEYPFGAGLGLGQPGGLHSVGLKLTRFIESEWGRIGYEVGVLGLIGVLAPRVVAAWMLWRGLQGTTDPRRRLVLAAALPLLCFSSMVNMAFNHTANTAAWAVVALSLPAALPAPASGRPRRVPASRTVG